MNQRELIEKLKDKTRAQPLGLLSDEERNILRHEAGPSHCLLLHESGKWVDKERSSYSFHYTYILKPDYEPKPEYIEIEIVLFHGSYRLKGQSPNNRGKKLCNVIGDQGFVCFHDDFSMKTTNAGDVPGWMRQHAAQDGVFKVHARFMVT